MSLLSFADAILRGMITDARVSACVQGAFNSVRSLGMPSMSSRAIKKKKKAGRKEKIKSHLDLASFTLGIWLAKTR